jgi:hypothetical protein
MGEKMIELDFGVFTLDAELFDNEIAKRFSEILPCQVNLTQWGGELYGSIGKDLGENSPVDTIPPGGLAYTRKGNYLCIFFGQTPAWAVEYIGRISGNSWEKLAEHSGLESVNIQRK